MPRDAERVLAGACPVVASYGAEDGSLRRDPARLERVLTASGTPHDVRTYAGAGHSFMNDHDAADVPSGLATLARVPIFEPYLGGGFEPASAQDARRRIAAFLRRYLSPEATRAEADAGR